MSKLFQRPLSIIERIWLGVDSFYAPYAVQIVLEGKGHVDEGQLRSAVAEASEVNPGSRLVLKGALHRLHWRDSGINPPVRRVAGNHWDGYTPAHASFFWDPLPHTGPTCEVLIVDGPMPRIVFRALHAVMDGRGAYLWMEDVFRCLRGEKPLGAFSTLAEWQVARRITNRKRELPPVESIPVTGKSRPSRPGTTWRRLTFYGEYPKVLGRVIWAVAQSAWRYGDGVVRLMIPVDLRSRIPEERSTGNLTITLYVDVKRDSTPGTIMQDLRSQIDQKVDCMLFDGGKALNLLPIRLLGTGIKMIAHRHRLNGLYSASGLITNLGFIDTRSLSGAGFTTTTTFVMPPRWDNLSTFILMTGSEGRVEIMVCVPNSLATDNRFERLLQDIGQAMSMPV